MLGDRAPQFVTSLIQISQTWQLAKCEPNSIIAAGMTAAALDLPINPNLGFAYIVPYGDRATFQIGYKGFVQLAVRSGQYKRLNVVEVYDGELLKYDRVKGDVVIDETKRVKDAQVIGYVAYFELTNGAEHAEYWSKDTVEKHANRFSQAYKAKKLDSPWFTNFDAMGKKTVLKSLLSHWGPLSVQMQQAVIEDHGFRDNPDAQIAYPDGRNMVEETAPALPGPAESPKRRGRPPKQPETTITVAEARPAAASQPHNIETTTQSVVRRIFDEAKVLFEDFRDFLVSQGIDRKAEDYPDINAVPQAVWDVLAANEATLTKITRTYGKAN